MNNLKKLLLSSIYIVLIFSTDIYAVRRGKEAKIERFPYMASVWHVDTRHICGAAIISEIYLLTAAHCLETGMEGQHAIVYGSAQFISSANVATIKKLHKHPDYSPPTYIEFKPMGGYGSAEPLFVMSELAKNDIAIIETDTPMGINLPTFPPPADADGPSGGKRQKYSVAKIDIARSTPEPCTVCAFAGWGLTSDAMGSEHSNVLLRLSMNIHCPDDCLYGRCGPKRNMFCAQHWDKRRSTGRGDSGGPLVCNGVIAGVLSTAHYKSYGYAIFTDVSLYYDSFIKPFLEKKPRG